MKRILVGLDASHRAPDVLSTAVDLARRMGGRLELVRAVTVAPELPANVWAVPASEIVESSLAAGKRQIEELATLVPPELLDGAKAVVGAPWDAICATAREDDADLIVIGAHGYGLVQRLLGTTAAKVVDHADRSVLVVRTGNTKEASS